MSNIQELHNINIDTLVAAILFFCKHALTDN